MFCAAARPVSFLRPAALAATILVAGCGTPPAPPTAAKPGGPSAVSTFPRVRQLVVEQLKIARERVTPQASFAQDLGADELDRVEIVMTLEEEFEIEIPDEEAKQMMTTVGSAAAYLDRKTIGGSPDAR